MKRIYVEAEENIIKEILEKVRPLIGEGVNVVDLNPELAQDWVD